VRLKEITISGFRGFKDQQTLNLSNNLILIRGANGSGKSSLVEAIEWLFFDEISRKKKSLCKSEYSGEFLRNLHCDENQETFVELLSEIGGREVRLRKKFLSPEKKEYYINGSLVNDLSSLGTSFADVYKPILSQIEVKHYVETDPKDRWEETNKILGLGVLSEFRSALQELQNSKKIEDEYDSSQKIYYGIEKDLEELPELENLVDAMKKRPFSAKTFKHQLIEIINKTYFLGARSTNRLSKTLEQEFKKLAQKSENFELITQLMVPENSLISCPSKLTEEIQKLFSLIREFKPFKAELYRFLETGKDLIKETTCPFCMEKTLTSEKIKQIDARIKENKEAGTLLSDIKTKLAETTKLVGDFTSRISFSANLSIISKVRERIEKNTDYLNEIKKIDLIKEQMISLNKEIAEFETDIEASLALANRLSEGRIELDEKRVSLEILAMEKAADMNEKSLKNLRDDLQSLVSSLLSKAPSLSAQEKTDMSKVIVFRKIIDHLDDINYVGIYENNLKTISGLVKEIEKFEKSKSKKLLTDLNYKIRDFYARLNPNEKTQFSELTPTSGKSRRMQIKAISYGKHMNPVSCFSESHMNCLCLSVYFSQRVLNNPYWDFVILDDPVQSMDEDHGKNLIRILGEVRTSKQVIVMSHNAKFCQDFTDLFYGQDYLFYEFSGYTIEGPKIDLKHAPYETYTIIAKKYFDGNLEERATSGNNLRKAIERFTSDLLTQNGKMSYSKAYGLSLDERLEKIETTKLLTCPEIGEIKAVLNVCDASSHEPPRREVASKELADGIATIENLHSTHLKREQVP
jgi:DNA repair exonuclease SbcCD ATPase subunit